MNTLLKVLLPPIISLAVFFFILRFTGVYSNFKFDEIGNGHLTGLMTFYWYALPLLFADATLTQLLIVVPLCEYLKNTPLILKVSIAMDMIIVCLLFAVGISYAIGDETTGMEHFVKLLTFMTGIQVLYWIINLSILQALSKSFIGNNGSGS